MLEVKNLSVRYGRHQALDRVSATIDKGEICVILGANGAGKSSLLKAIAGTVRAEPGSEIRMNGVSIAGMKAHKIVGQGVALVPEGRGIFGELTVAENLELGAFPGRARAREREELEQIYALFPRLAERKSQIARTMSGGEQQMVAIGRALMSQPEILMLDEPSLGLSPVLTKELFRSLARIAETGVGILLVEQNARQSLKIAGRGYLIEVGRITGEGSAQSLMTDPAVVNAYLGGARQAAPAPVKPSTDGRWLAACAFALAEVATSRFAKHIRALRASRQNPSAFVGLYDPAKASTGIDDMSPASLARTAAERMAEHVRNKRLAAPVPSAFAPTQPEHGALGHNSRGVLDVEPESARRIDIEKLVARATAIQASHVAARREGLTKVVLRPQDWLGGGDEADAKPPSPDSK